MSTYFFFLKERTTSLEQEQPTLSRIEMVKQTATEWKELSVEVKQTYEALAQADRQRYAEEKEANNF